MAKQIKIGFDIHPAPVTKQFTQLVDIEGTPLFDDAGNPLVTEENSATDSVLSASNSLPIHANNEVDDTGGGAVPIEEQFKEFSEVSSSLLGVPRAEEQLSLFSDVATYGLDVDNWDATDIFNGHGNNPYEWYRKEHPVHGRRSNASFNEGTDEQALYLEAFPSQYSFPFGPKALRQSTPTSNFKRYMNFIALGRYLYEVFKNVDRNFADRNFLTRTQAEIVKVGDNEPTAEPIVLNVDTAQTTGEETFFSNAGEWFDVKYGEDNIQDSFDAIERFTAFYNQISDRTALFPQLPGDMLTVESQGIGGASIAELQTQGYPAFRSYKKILIYVANGFVRPGDRSNIEYYGILQSKRTFRYQPGRVSGFTFGTRMDTNETSTETTLEWGCANDTDQYMFQLRGSRFSIVRRSTIQMPDELLVRQGLTAQHQSATPVPVKGIGNDSLLYETTISRTDFNGDQLLGSGDSGAFFNGFEQVTMYKIEFSWYGAIGAKFYAYVPVGNGEARWVLLHTFVIENGLGEPVLANPDFRFRYIIHTDDTANIRKPLRLYKYGSSCYIDGGDEGTIRLSTTTVDTKAFSERTSILGILPKESISNTVGELKENFKKTYPSTISVTSSKNCRLDFEEIKGSPQGVHFNYSPSLHMTGRNPRTRKLKFKYVQGSGQSVSGKTIIRPQSPAVANADPRFADVSPTYKVNVSGSAVTIDADGLGAGDPTTFAGLQIGDSLSFGSSETKYRIKEFDVPSGVGNPNYSSTGKTGLVLEDTPDPSSLSLSATTATLHYLINTSEINSHVIANGVYGTYIGSGDIILNRGEANNEDYSLVEGIARDSVFANSDPNSPVSIFSESSTDLFEGALSGYNTVVASNTPIRENKFKIHFLNPSAKDPGLEYDPDTATGAQFNDHFAEFSVGVTPYKPLASDDGDRTDSSDPDPQVKFVQTDSGGGTVNLEYNRNEFPTIEYCHHSQLFNNKVRALTQEVDQTYGNRLEVDPRLNRFGNGVEGVANSRGNVSTVQGEVGVNSYPFASVVQNVDDGSGNLRTKIIFPADASSPRPSASEIQVNVSEVGVNFGPLLDGQGNPFVFLSNLIDSTAVDEGPHVFVDASAYNALNSLNPKVIQTKTITLKDDWRATSLVQGTTGYEERFSHKKFSVSKAVSFNTQPLYPVFALGDYAKVNSIVIEEISQDGKVKTHTPTFVKESPTWNPKIQVLNVGNSLPTNPPSAFNEIDSTSACRYDTSNLNPLRPGDTIYSYYVGENETTTIQLDNIFARDRKGISRGALNNRAVYITATALEDGVTGNLQLSLTNKEQ